MDPHSALLGGHSTPNTVVLGEGILAWHGTLTRNIDKFMYCGLVDASWVKKYFLFLIILNVKSVHELSNGK